MSTVGSFIDDFSSETGLEYLEEKQESREKHNLSKTPLKWDTFVEKAHSSSNYWQPHKKLVSYNTLRGSPSETLSTEQDYTENTKETFRRNKSLPCKAITSQQKPGTNPVKTRHTTTVPTKLYSHEATKYRTVSRAAPSNVGCWKRTTRKKDAAPKPKQATPYAIQRLLSARKLRIDDLRNQIIDLNRQLQEARKEIKFMKEVYDRQQKELQRIEKTRGEIPDMEKSHDEELRIIRAMNRKLKDKIKHLEQTLKNKEEGLQRVTNTLQNLKVSFERKKHAETEYEKKMKSLTTKLAQKEDTIKALNEKVETLTQELAEEGLKNEITKTICEELQKKLKDNCSESATKADGTDSAWTLDTVDEKHQEHPQTTLGRTKNFSMLENPSSRELRRQGKSPNPQKQKSCLPSIRKKEFPSPELPLNNEHQEQNRSPNPQKDHSYLVSSMRKELSMFKSGSEKVPSKQMAPISLPTTYTKGRSKIAARCLISSPEKIFSRLQDMCLEDQPRKIPPTPSDLNEGEFSGFTNDVSQRRNSKGTYIALNQEAMIRKSPPTLPRRRK